MSIGILEGLTIEALRTRFAARDRSEFLREFDCPFLVDEQSGQRLYPVRKPGAQNPFGTMITIGRAPNNDIVLPHETVSKFHAYFWRSGHETWSIVDAGSSNGTSVEGAPLVPKVKASLALADDHPLTLAFGAQAKLLFATPRSFWALLGGK